MPRGRPRDPELQQRILDATFALLADDAHTDVRIDDIASAAGVGRQTIYRWWPSKSALAMDALVRATMNATPFPDTGDTHADLQEHMRKVARLFGSRTGSMITALVAEAQHDDAVATEFVARFWTPRRELSRACLRRGIERGQVRADIDVEAVLDALYGPLWIRLLFRHQPVSAKLADTVLEVVWSSIRDDG